MQLKEEFQDYKKTINYLLVNDDGTFTKSNMPATVAFELFRKNAGFGLILAEDVKDIETFEQYPLILRDEKKNYRFMFEDGWVEYDEEDLLDKSKAAVNRRIRKAEHDAAKAAEAAEAAEATENEEQTEETSE